jgi:pimeloyl-ACP methyl ester carboxylesterase
MHLDDQPTGQPESPAGGVLCVRSGEQPPGWFVDQVYALAAIEWGPDGDPDDEAWVAQAVDAVADQPSGAPVHMIASGTGVPRALALAAHRPDLVTSIVACDPVVDESDPAYRELLRQVRAPTLVVVAASRADTDTSQAQTVAGGIENGVMVIVDGAVAPVHRSNPHSFAEWVTAFMSIAEGLQALAPPATEEARA